MNHDEDIQAQLEALPPELQETIKKQPPGIRETMLRLYHKSLVNEAREEAEKIRATISPGGQATPQQMWAPCAKMPSDMCRVSPFFPLSKQEMARREYVRDLTITKSSWGEIKYTGPRLSVYEEDVLLAVLALLDQGAPSYTYNGPLLPVLRLMGYEKYGGADYKKILGALKLLIGTVIELTVSRKKGKKPKLLFASNIISAAKWDDEKQELHVAVNPYFAELYAKGGVTLLDVQERMQLKTQVARALYRFCQSQNNLTDMHFMTLAAALNLDLEAPAFRTRDRIKKAITELVKHGILDNESGFRGKDIVRLARTPQSRIRHKLIEG